MQSDNKNNSITNNRFAALRSKLKILPILHSTTDRINTLIAQQKGAEKKIEYPDTDSEDLEEFEAKSSSSSNSPKNFQDKFTVGKKLGEGAHGFVKECFHKKTGKKFALKTIRTDNEFFIYLKRNFVNIVGLNHPNIIKYNAFYFDLAKETCLLVMEYLPFPNLSEIQIQNQEELKKIIYDVIQGLEYIHKKHICHRDLKPENILYDRENKHTILIDFGCSCNFFQRGTSREMLTMTGTSHYRAPEMLIGGGYDQAVDLWALGVLIFRIIEKVTPFETEYHSDTINKITKGEFNFNNEKWSGYSHLMKDLVSHLLKPKKLRLNIQQAKNHFWFENLKQNMDEEMIKSAGFQSFFTLKRTATQCRNSSSITRNHLTLSPILTAVNTPKMFNLQKYQDEQKKIRWLSLDGAIGNQMDLIQSEDEESTLSPSPKLPKKKNESK